MTDILASRASSSRPSQIVQQKPSKSLTTALYDDDEKYGSDYDASKEQEQAKKDKLSYSLAVDDSKDIEYSAEAEVESQSEADYALEPKSEPKEPSYSLQSKQDDDMDYVADVYPEFYSQEMESALANVRKLALFHKESLVNS